MSKDGLSSDMLITKQKNVAKRVFGMLNKVDIGCILAGGAPRDWRFGKPCRDLDFYFTAVDSRHTFTKKQLSLVGFDNIHSNQNIEEGGLYSTMKDIVRIWNTEIDGIPVQLIQMRTLKGRYKVVEEMDVSICKVWCKDDIEVKTTSEFDQTILTKIITVKDGCEKGNHLKKIKGYFPEYKIGTIEDVNRKMFSIIKKDVNNASYF